MAALSVASEPLDALWAKSALPGQARGESLVDHTHNVLRVLAELQRIWPDLPVRLTCPRFWHLCFWACVIHDFGKAALGFQQQLKPGGAPWSRRHEVLSLAFLGWLLSSPGDPDRAWLSAAVATHHKDAATIAERYPQGLDAEDDCLIDMVNELTPSGIAQLYKIVTELADRWRQECGFDRAGVNLVSAPGLSEELPLLQNNGRDRILANLRALDLLVEQLRAGPASDSASLLAIALRGIVMHADHRASAHAFGARPTTLRGAEDLVQRLARDWQHLHEHQREAAQARGSVMLTAPTGSGKTEAALLWASSQAVSYASPRLFYVLPFQASMNAMHVRLDRTFPGEVGLQHGRSLHALYRRYLDTEPDGRNAERMARRAKNLVELHFHPVRVLSPYQLLKAFYRLRGYESILVDLYDALFVLDEIHAYEPARLALILGMFNHLRRHYNAKFLVMSATLPSMVRDHLIQSLGVETRIEADSDLYRHYRRHAVHLLDGDLAVDGHRLIMGAVRNGSSVLVCCNTVARAQALWETLSAEVNGSVDVDLLHSGFNARDRMSKESRAMEAMAAGVARTAQMVLVATQVVEVSLNIDFDVLFSDPAPLDALLQRFGRVNRLGVRDLAPVHVFTQPDDGQHVYDAQHIRGTLQVLRRISGGPIDESQTSAWLDEVYTGEVAAAWRKSFEHQSREFEQGCLATLRAFQSDDALEDKFFDAFDAVEVLPACLLSEYEALCDDRPLAADGLLVSIRTQRLARLKKAGRAQRTAPGEPYIVDVPYSPLLGLSTRDEEAKHG
jgi:CRISPR-associated endonuclease/helicase Cas3